jgi:outer membrane protein TolC
VKFDAGAVSELDVDQAESLLYNTKATVYSLETSLQQLKNSLAILLGKPPHDLNYLFTDGVEIPTAPANVALGMPQDLLRRRPDVRSAERGLAAQSAQIGFAVSELYPHFTIGGSIGTSAFSTSEMFNKDSTTWSLFGLFEWDVFNYGRLKSNVRLQDARFQQLLVDYGSFPALGRCRDHSVPGRLDHVQHPDHHAGSQYPAAGSAVGNPGERGHQPGAGLQGAAMKAEMRERTGAWKGVLN